jgi:peptidyl-prolyl cis-trans isomerase B (cyclophilin B)
VKRLRLLPLAVLACGLAACAQTPAPVTSPTPTQSSTPSPTPAPTTRAAAAPGVIDCAYSVSGQAARPVDPPPTTNIPASGTVAVTLHLNAGSVTLTLDRARTPCTVNSFLSLLEQGFYNDTTCHRLVDRGIFVLQCGDPTGTGAGGPGYSYADETYSDDRYPAGTVAMANAGPNTNGSQFFFVYQDSSLSPDYTVFGHLDAQGTKLIAEIAGGGQDGSNADGSGWPNIETVIEGYSMG